MIKRLIMDLETSPNVVYSWRTGYNLNIGHDNMIQERAIICICYKWEGEEKVHSLTWDKDHCDKAMLLRFKPVMDAADEVVAHNGDRFDVKWFRTRCLFHNIPCQPKFVTDDTLKSAKGKFYFNSNRLDYIAQFLKVGKKTETGGFQLWKDVLSGKKSALKQMVDYCKNDVAILEAVWQKLSTYTEPKIHAGVQTGGYKHHCPRCGGPNTKRNRKTTTALGTPKVQMICTSKGCGSYFTLTESVYMKSMADEEKALGRRITK